MTYPGLDELLPPHFHDHHRGAIGQNVGELELDAVDKEFVVVDGGRVVGHDGMTKRLEMIGIGVGRQLKVERQGVILICVQHTSSFGHSTFGWLFVTHNDLTSTTPRMTSWPLLLDPLIEDCQ